MGIDDRPNPTQTRVGSALPRQAIVGWDAERFDELEASAMKWKAGYSPGDLVQKNTVVEDDGWLMIANDETDERAAPVDIGDPLWVGEGGNDTPAWGNFTQASNTILTGKRFNVTGQAVRLLTGAFWVPDVSGDFEYEVFVIEDPLGPNPRYSQVWSRTVPANTGWVYINAPEIIVPPFTFDLYLAKYSTTFPTIFNGNWNQVNTNAANPATGDMHFRNSTTEMRFNFIDNDGGNRTAELQSVKIGGSISDGERTWTVIGVNESGDWIEFIIEPGGQRPAAALRNYEFVIGSVEPIPYVRIDDYYAGGGVQGLFSATGAIADVVVDNHHYGLDTRWNLISASQYWDFMAYSEFTSAFQAERSKLAL